jgi:hypothetical protein
VNWLRRWSEDVKRRAGIPNYVPWHEVFASCLGNFIGRAIIGASFTVGVLAVADLWGVV